MPALTLLSCALVTALGASLIVWLIGDFLAFSRAILHCRRTGRLDEWFAQPRRMVPGSGYRLHRKFCRR